MTTTNPGENEMIETNGVTASDYMNDASTMLTVLREARDRARAALGAKRGKLLEQLAEVDAALAEVNGARPQSPQRSRAQARGTGSRPTRGPATLAIVGLLERKPNLTAGEVLDELPSIKREQIHALLRQLQYRKKIVRSGPYGQYRYAVAAEA
jgi:hypothetical protein